MDDKRKTPKLRFPGFTDNWEQRKLEDISANYKYSIVDGPFGSDLKTADYTEDGVLVMQSNYITGGKFEIKQPYYVSLDKAEQLSRCHCKGGDILIAKIGANFGICNIIPENVEDAVLSSNCMKVDLDENHDNSFYMQYFNTLYESGFYYSLVGITAQPALSLKFMKSLEVPSPSIEEQRKIASFLENLDNLIILHQRKLEQMKEYKKGMLQKMFPKNGETVPEIRFPGFTDAWEQRKFGELYKKSSEKNDGSIGMDKNITVATMQFKEDVKVSTEDYLRTYYTFNVGDIAFEGHQSKDFRFGRFVENDIGNGIVSHIFAVFRPIVDYDLKFWKYAINNESLMQRVLSRSTKASTMMHDLVTDDFLEQSFLVPSVEEQNQIGEFLAGIDNLITLHQRKSELMKEYKKGLLQQMFV